MPFAWLSGIFLGITLGANNTAAVFGAAVSVRMLAWRRAALLTAVFVLLGALLEGGRGLATLTRLAPADLRSTTLALFAAALVIGFMTWRKMPASASHAVIGALAGLSLFLGHPQNGLLSRILIGWLVMPFGAITIVLLLDFALRPLFRRLAPSVFEQDPILRAGLVLCGCYGAYSLGANTVANAAVVFSTFPPQAALLTGGLAIAAGAAGFGRRVIATVGQGIARMNSFDAMVTVLGMALTLHLFAKLGIPVSIVHAIIGAIVGRSLRRGIQTVRWNTLGRIGLSFLLVPLASALLAVLLYVTAHLTYVPG